MVFSELMASIIALMPNICVWLFIKAKVENQNKAWAIVKFIL
jgi:hypothetical protein